MQPNSVFGEMKREYVLESLVRTADDNYILARHAFSRDMLFDGYWLAAQAVEKYSKASLLLNGGVSRAYGHDIQKLHVAHRVIAGDHMPANFIRPKPRSKSSFAKWDEEDDAIEKFIALLGYWGHSENRYQHRGFWHDHFVTVKLDQLTYWLRRTCCNLSNNAEALAEPRCWKLSERMPLEELSQNLQTAKAVDWLTNNAMWAPVVSGGEAVTSLKPGFSFRASAVVVALNRAKAAKDDDARREFLLWLAESVHMTRADQAYLRKSATSPERDDAMN